MSRQSDVLREGTCAHCHRKFAYWRANAKYCTPRCRLRAYRAKKREIAESARLASIKFNFGTKSQL